MSRRTTDSFHSFVKKRDKQKVENVFEDGVEIKGGVT
jgi:hypothetical protein